MKNRLISIALSLGLVLSALAVAPAAVSAASSGACGSSSTQHYVNGNEKLGSETPLIKSVKATITIPDSSQFKQCSPDDNAGSNGPSAIIEMYRYLPPYGAWVQAGIVRCENTYVYCTGTPRIFTEWHDALTGVSLVRDLGAASYDTPYTIEIYLTSSQNAQVRVNGTTVTSWAVGSQLNPGDDPSLYWFTENHDSGDGLGSNTSGNSTNFAGMSYLANGTTWLRTSSCNYGNTSESVCVKNGANGLYFYTVN